LIKRLIAPSLTCIFLLTVAYLQLSGLRDQTFEKKETYLKETALEQTRLSLLKQLSAFGFDNLVADWAFLSFLQYFGDGLARQQTDYSLVPDYFEVIIKHDPRFVDAYLYLSPASSIYAGRPDKTVTLMNQGLKSLSPSIPSSYNVWLYKGTDELLFLGNNKAAKHSHEMAAKWASQSETPDSKRIARIAGNTAQFLAKNPDSKQAQFNSWMMVLNAQVDRRARHLAIRHIEALGGKVSVTPQGELKVQPPADD